MIKFHTLPSALSLLLFFACIPLGNTAVSERQMDAFAEKQPISTPLIYEDPELDPLVRSATLFGAGSLGGLILGYVFLVIVLVAALGGSSALAGTFAILTLLTWALGCVFQLLGWLKIARLRKALMLRDDPELSVTYRKKSIAAKILLIVSAGITVAGILTLLANSI